MFKQVKRFMRDEEGATAIEYGLIVGLIAVVMIGALIVIGPALGTIWNDASTTIEGAVPADDAG